MHLYVKIYGHLLMYAPALVPLLVESVGWRVGPTCGRKLSCARIRASLQIWLRFVKVSYHRRDCPRCKWMLQANQPRGSDIFGSEAWREMENAAESCFRLGSYPFLKLFSTRDSLSWLKDCLKGFPIMLWNVLRLLVEGFPIMFKAFC